MFEKKYLVLGVWYLDRSTTHHMNNTRANDGFLVPGTTYHVQSTFL